MLMPKQKAKKTVAFFCLLFCICLSGADWAEAAITSLQPASLFVLVDKENFFGPDYLFAQIVSDTATTSINAVLAGLSYSTSTLDLVAVQPDENACPLLMHQAINHRLGRLDLICGNPDNFSGRQTIAYLVFRKITAGQAELSILPYSSLRAADGLGTDLPLQRETHRVQIIK